MRTLFYVLAILVIVTLIRKIFYATRLSPESKELNKFRFRPKVARNQAWVQVYDTDSFDEINSLQARLEEDEVECFVYEQGRKDIHGNQLKGYGIAVPRTSVSHAQKIISRMPV